MNSLNHCHELRSSSVTNLSSQTKVVRAYLVLNFRRLVLWYLPFTVVALRAQGWSLNLFKAGSVQRLSRPCSILKQLHLVQLRRHPLRMVQMVWLTFIRRFGSGVLLVISGTCTAQTSPPRSFARLPSVLQTRCDAALKETPALPIPGPGSTAPGKPACSPLNLYYGVDPLGASPRKDAGAALTCALQLRQYRAQHPEIVEDAFDVDLVPAEIFANGLTGPANPALALHFACQAVQDNLLLPAAQIEGLEKAAQTNAAHPRAVTWDACAGVPSTGEEDLWECAHLRFGYQHNDWLKQVNALSTQAQDPPWTTAQQALLLRFAEAATLEARSATVHAGYWPPAQPGVNASLSQTDEKIIPAEDALLNRLRAALAGSDAPPASLSDLNEAESALNRTYTELLDHVRAEGGASVPDMENVRQSQRRWLAFRDAWDGLLASRQGAAAARNWQTILDREQTLLLARTVAAMPPIPAALASALDACHAYGRVPLPAEAATPFSAADEPTQAAAAEGALSCSAEAFYGAEGSPDFARARRCAWEERRAGGRLSGALGGQLILAALYANGQGTARNGPLAARMACESLDAGFFSDSDTDTSGPDTPLVTLLHDIAPGRPRAAQRVDPCAYTEGSTRYISGCDSLKIVLRQDRLRHDLSEFGQTLSPAQQRAWQILLDALREYWDMHDEKEVLKVGHYVTSGYDQGSLPDAEEDLLNNLKHFGAGKLPPARADDYPAAEKRLAGVYTEALARAARQSSSGLNPTPEGLRQTERAWLTYRESWVRFGGLRFPGVAADSWRTWLTAQRAKDLADPCFFQAPCQ